jgi:hypothetical protein
MPDQSALDQRYFISDDTYNCPFCNRGSVGYQLVREVRFDWTDSQSVWAYFAQCVSCRKISMHLSKQHLRHPSYITTGPHFPEGGDLDSAMFYSVPSSFHVIDENIPANLRELVAEAEGSLKSNFLTGASACLRKVVYELATREGAGGASYEDRIKSLKDKFPGSDPTYFDTLLTVQQVTSDKVHEEAYDGWQAKHLRIILASVLEILNEIYVIPARRAERRKSILALKDEVLTAKRKLPDNASGEIQEEPQVRPEAEEVPG